MDVEAGAVAAEVWTTVVVCAGAVTVSVCAGAVTVCAGAVTVSVCAGAVTVSVRAGAVTVSVFVGGVVCVLVPVSRLDPLDDAVDVVLVLGDTADCVVPAVALLLVAADVLVDVVRVCVMLLATLWTFPEPHPATARTAARNAAVEADALRTLIAVRMLPRPHRVIIRFG